VKTVGPRASAETQTDVQTAEAGEETNGLVARGCTQSQRDSCDECAKYCVSEVDSALIRAKCSVEGSTPPFDFSVHLVSMVPIATDLGRLMVVASTSSARGQRPQDEAGGSNGQHRGIEPVGLRHTLRRIVTTVASVIAPARPPVRCERLIPSTGIFHSSGVEMG